MTILRMLGSPDSPKKPQAEACGYNLMETAQAM
jgi:hypothetical protein